VIDLIKKSFYRVFNAIYGKVGRLASTDVVIELLKTKCMPIAIIYGLDACPASPRHLDLLTMLLCRVVENFFNANSFEIAAECLKMFGVSVKTDLSRNTC